ncbi:hypothetical protein N658DRAFT_417996 [Parathielavia hyrcaniae]|uniref:Malate dehydrogenase n=1 Tax=Parathielavia hyrcaniae TaxID=113614 RepID=A0AAN6Q785_9PEZI|nr:hypothetical protein N658DRAFT_417996 [Parathielavia hyrcaniae]
MHASVLLVSALAASVWGAPAFPKINLVDKLEGVTDYFNMLASKVQDSRSRGPPVCDLSSVSLPAGASTMAPPSEGLVLKHIAIGRGTQNYTCNPATPGDAPKANGAVATLFNASCAVATSMELAAALTRAALYFDLAQSETLGRLSPSNLGRSGVHFFTDSTTPFFNLDSSAWKLGEIPCAKQGSAPAPQDAPRGLSGEPAVAWLKLDAKPGATGGLQEVYRLFTVGGSPPATCEGLPSTFEIQYSTQ